MAAVRRRAIAAAGVLAVLTLAGPPLVSARATSGDPDRGDPSAPKNVATTVPAIAKGMPRDQSGLAVTIDAISPSALKPGKPLRLSGQVTNVGEARWRDAQVYLDIASDPVTTKGGLDDLTSSDEPFGTRIVRFGLFDEIGSVPAGATKSYRLNIPYSELPLSGASGVYRVGVSVLATNRDGARVEDARADTVISLVADLDTAPTKVTTVVPVTAPIIRHPSGNFLDDRLAVSLAAGGQLRNLVDFLNAVPVDTVEIVVDPALLDAVQDMTDGYFVTTRQDEADDNRGRGGTGQVAAEGWLAAFNAATSRQDVLLMAWASPDASALAHVQMPGIVEAAVHASDEYAVDQGLIAPTVSWQKGGSSTRRGLVVARTARAVIQFVSAASLVDLVPSGDSAYLPPLVTMPTARGPLTAAVTASELAGQRLTANTSVLDFRQDLMAESTVRSLEGVPGASPALIALPFGWDPGDQVQQLDVAAAYELKTVNPVDLEAATQSTPTTYEGPIRPLARQGLSEELLTAVARLRTNGYTFSDLLTDNSAATAALEQRLAESASSLWVSKPQERLALIRMQARGAAEQLSKVTVTGPTFVALSSGSGRFPLTITNNLLESVTLRVNVRPRNPALRIDPIEDLVLEPGQSRDIEVTTRSDRSGLTPVRVRLTTVTDHVFGAPWEFDVRATQIGLAIWVVMGLGGVILVGTAGFRLVRRFRTQGLHPRQKPSP